MVWQDHFSTSCRAIPFQISRPWWTKQLAWKASARSSMKRKESFSQKGSPAMYVPATAHLRVIRTALEVMEEVFNVSSRYLSVLPHHHKGINSSKLHALQVNNRIVLEIQWEHRCVQITPSH